MRRKTKEDQLDLARLYETGQYNLNEFCKSHGIKKHALYYWRRKLTGGPLRSSKQFIPLETVMPESESEYSIELKLVDGTIVNFNKLVPVSYIKELLG